MSLNLVLRRGLGLVAVAGLAVVPLHAQVAAAAASTPAYDVVSIKPNKGGDGRMMFGMSGDGLNGTNITLKMMLRSAYGLKTEDQIVGLTGALDSAHFDVQAKMDAETVAAQKKLSKEDATKQQQAMLQAMLAEQFKLKLHHETKEQSLYDLVIAKGGSKLKEADPNNPDAPKDPNGVARAGMMRMGRGELTAYGVVVSRVAEILAQNLHKQVNDKTGLTGKYDIHLKWTPDEMTAETKEATDGEQAPSIYIAIEEQLGLKLNAVKGQVDTVVIDHVEMPPVQ